MISTWSRGSCDEHMDEAILVDLAPRIARHPWWIARASLTVALLERLAIRPPSTVLDAGCGWGVTFSALERRGYRATGLDVSRKALTRIDGNGRTLVEADLTRPSPPDAPVFDAVLALDVIEHLDDDAAAVAHLAERVAPGGALVVSVPALPELFSEFDSIQGHRRRYQPESLRAAFATSGLTVERVFWWEGGWRSGLRNRGRGQSRARGNPPLKRMDVTLPCPPGRRPWPSARCSRTSRRRRWRADWRLEPRCSPWRGAIDPRSTKALRASAWADLLSRRP